jgi:hypothetical protein
MQKNKSDKIILSAPKTAATLIIAATLNIAPTVLYRDKDNMFSYKLGPDFRFTSDFRGGGGGVGIL